LARWRHDTGNAVERLEEVADGLLHVLHATLRADRSAFGLYDTTCAAGDRLTAVLGSLARQGPESPDALIARLALEVGGGGGTLADAVVRRAVVRAGRHVIDRRAETAESLPPGSTCGGWAWDLLCDLYQVFFAQVVAEFLRSVIAEHIKLSVPVLVAIDPEGTIAERVADRLLELVPSPCEEAAGTAGPAEALDTAVDVVQDPDDALAQIARRLEPRAVAKVLGVFDEESAEGEAA
jgi:hypothetical protein